MNKNLYNFSPKKTLLNFRCDWGVFPKYGDSSVCYATDKKRARLVSISLNRFMNSDEGKKWIEKNMS